MQTVVIDPIATQTHCANSNCGVHIPPGTRCWQSVRQLPNRGIAFYYTCIQHPFIDN